MLGEPMDGWWISAMKRQTEERSKGTLTRLPTYERITHAIRTGLQLIPFGIGSAIDTWYFGSIEARKLARVETWLTELSGDLARLQESCKRVPGEFFGSDQFAFMLEGTIRRVGVEVSEEKLRALRGILVSVIINEPAIAFEKQSSFLRTVDVIEGSHMRILQLLRSRMGWAGKKQFVGFLEICEMLGAKNKSDANLAYSALDTLANREFIQTGPIPFDKAGGLDKDRQVWRATELGVEFLDFMRMAPKTLKEAT